MKKYISDALITAGLLLAFWYSAFIFPSKQRLKILDQQAVLQDSARAERVDKMIKFYREKLSAAKRAYISIQVDLVNDTLAVRSWQKK